MTEKKNGTEKKRLFCVNCERAIMAKSDGSKAVHCPTCGRIINFDDLKAWTIAEHDRKAKK